MNGTKDERYWGLCRLVQERGCTLHHRTARLAMERRRLRRLRLNVGVEIRSAHSGAIRWLDLDPAEGRYLLTGGADGKIALYDMMGGAVAVKAAPRRISALFSSSRPRRGASQRQLAHASISSVQWYPVDSGLFISAGMDGMVKAWDANSESVATEFQLNWNVYAALMSPLCCHHTLIATGTQDAVVRLCDLASGSSSHLLVGHTGAVWSIAWSPTDEHVLATGSADCTVRLWDIRRSGQSACLHSFDRDLGVNEVQFAHGEESPRRSFANAAARAHGGPVNSLSFTPDGLYLITSGADNRLRCWDVWKGENTLVNYLGTINRRRFPFKMAIHHDAIFFPNDGPSGLILPFTIHSHDGQAWK
jgi:DNA excision repair protein ERCC-8